MLSKEKRIEIMLEGKKNQAWGKLSTVWKECILEIAEGNFNQNNPLHIKCVQVMALVIKAELNIKQLI